MSAYQALYGVVAVAIGFCGGVSAVEAFRSVQPRRGTLGLVSATCIVLTLAVVVIIGRTPPP